MEQRVYRVAIAGAGQLGSRHLQALSLTKIPLAIDVMDISAQSLEVAEKRWHEMPTNPLVQSIKFSRSIKEFAPEIDVAIIPTGSKARLSVLKELLETKRVKYVVLEKFLFPCLSDYDEAQRLIEKHNVKAWVNCGRRAMSFYNMIHDLVCDDKHLTMSVCGTNWGLGCNAIHHLDLYSFLTDQRDFDFDLEYLDDGNIDSKRAGYIEFTGALRLKSPKGTLLLTSYSPAFTPDLNGGGWYSSIITIHSEHIYCVVEESQQRAKVMRRHADGWYWDEFEVDGKLQSQVTQDLVAQLIETGDCLLPTYEVSARLHKVLLEGFLQHLNQFGEERIELCPIT